MELTEDRIITAPRAAIWTALFDPEVLQACVPGCQALTGSTEEGFEAVVVQKVGPVKATFKGTVTMTDVVTGESCTLIGEGKGGAAGFAKGEARVVLADAEGGATKLSYLVNAKVGGKLAQLGSRVVDGFARKMAQDFFARFQEQVEPPKPETDSAETAAQDISKPSWVKRTFGS
jgi:uncharacterized protein